MTSKTRGFDRIISVLIARLPRRLDPFMEALTFIGQPFIVVGAGAAGLLAAYASGEKTLQKAFIGALAAFFLGTILKRLIRRDRPGHLDVESFGLKSYSFPSGHAFGSVIVFGLYGVLDVQRALHPWGIVSACLIGALIILIGVSRIYLKAHFPSDVLGGWLFGLAALAIITRTIL